MAFNQENPDVFVIDKEDTKEEKKVDEPKMWKVIMHNDDFTPMDYVVHVLTTYFGKKMEEAIIIMMAVHEQGKGIAGVYTHDIAETKSAIVNRDAQDNGHPFLTTIEEE